MAVMDFEMFEGDTKILRVTVRDEDGVVVNITGVDIRWWLAKTSKVAPADALIKKDTVDGIDITDGAGGVFEVTLEPADTEGKGGKTYYHEAEVNDNGVVSTVLTGAGTIKRTLIP